MKVIGRVLPIVVLVLTAHQVHASGPLGIYGIIERVVFERTGTSERIQLWGVFAFVDRGFGGSGAITEPAEGYLYFTMPVTTDEAAETIRAEWSDLASIAGTRQAVGFGDYSYIGDFGGLRSDKATQTPPYILVGRSATTTLRVRAESEPVSDPTIYSTNVGVVRLDAQGSHGDVVERLLDLLD